MAAFPVQLQAEAEGIYVTGMDIDHIESSNKLALWLDELKYLLVEASPFLGEFLLPEGTFAEMYEEDSDYEGSENLELFDD